MIHRQLGYAARRAVRSIISAPVLQLVAVSTIALSLLVFCVVVTLAVNLDRAAARWGDEMGVVAFLAADHDPHALTEAKATVAAWPEVGTVRVYTRAEALADLREALGNDAALLEGVDPRVVPASIEVVLAPSHQSPAASAMVAQKLRALPGLVEVGQLDTGEDLLGRLSEVRDLLQLGGLVVGILVLLAVTFIISNTIRLTLYARRAELEVMRLVGAAEWFVRVPCYLEGAVQGAAGAVIALLGTWALVVTLPRWSPLEADDLPGGQLVFLSSGAMLALVVGAAAMGVIASHVAAGRFGAAGGVSD
jgi:cell division transport system permease protein